jgi:glycerophosphoryl diester phosphodiesterase
MEQIDMHTVVAAEKRLQEPGRMLGPSRIEPPVVIAHRGFSARYPENTMPAFRAALEAGAEMVEFDVQLTRDKRPAVFHDQTVDRTTNGSGRIRDLSLGEIYQLDAGSWFDPAFAGTRVPGIQDVLRELAGHCLINVELKTSGDTGFSERSALACAVLGVVRSRGLLDSVLFSSFDVAVLKLIRRMEPDAALGILTRNRFETASAVKLATDLRALSVNPRAGLLEAEMIERARDTGLLVLAWPGPDENDEKHMRRALELGADGFFADDVPALRRVADGFRRDE